MKLFLSGGGSDGKSTEVDKKYIEVIDKTKPILYIPIAIDTNKHPYSGCLNWIKGNFARYHFDNFVMWVEDDLKNKTGQDFEQFGGIYIGGGNTFKLLNDLKNLDTFEILKSLALNDIPIYGGSAGAVILAKSIITASYLDKNEINLADFSALNLINGYDVWCHYKPEMEQDVKEYMQKYNMEKAIAIPEDAGVYVSEKEIRAIGPNTITIFTNTDNKLVVKPEDLIL